jgi:hypothetical protein
MNDNSKRGSENTIDKEWLDQVYPEEEFQKDLLYSDVVTSYQRKLSSELGVQISCEDAAEYAYGYWDCKVERKDGKAPQTFEESAQGWQEGRRLAMEWLRKKYGLEPLLAISKQVETPNFFKTVLRRLNLLRSKPHRAA